MIEAEMTLLEKATYIAAYPLIDHDGYTEDGEFVVEGAPSEDGVEEALLGFDLYSGTGAELIADGLTHYCGDRIKLNSFYVLDIQHLAEDGTMSDPDGIQLYLGETIQEALETLQDQWNGSDGEDMWGGEDFRHELSFKKYNRDFGKHVQNLEVACCGYKMLILFLACSVVKAGTLTDTPLKLAIVSIRLMSILRSTRFEAM